MLVSLSGVLDYRAYLFMDMLEWRTVAAFTSRLWAMVLRPLVLALSAALCAALAFAAVVGGVAAACVAALLTWAATSGVGVVGVDGAGDNIVVTVRSAAGPTAATVLTAIAAIRTAAFVLASVGVAVAVAIAVTVSIAKPMRLWDHLTAVIETWREDLRRQRFQVGRQLQQYALRQDAAAAATRRS